MVKTPRKARVRDSRLWRSDCPNAREFRPFPRGAGDLARMGLVLFLGALGCSVQAARLGEVRTVDDEIVMVRWLDSEVEWKDTGTGPRAFRGLEDSAGEALWNAPYCYANNEFTPQQSMRGKMCLLAYLYALGQTYHPTNATH